MIVFLWIVGSVATLIGVGFLYQWIGAHRDRMRFAGPGRWVTIGRGHSLYILEKGSGGPTVLFEAGIAATNLNWFHIQETVSRFTGTVSYDRSGLGWSSPCRTVRTPGNIAVELRDMLQCARIKPPYILVGHSFGGLVMHRYALLYPEHVAGVVLLDPMRCEEWPPLDPSKQSQIDLGRKLFRFAVPFAHFGLVRLAVTSLICRSGPHLAPTGRRRRQWRPPCAGTDHGRGGQDAQGSLAHRRRPLVAARLLRRYAKPRRGGSRHGQGNAGRWPHSRHSRAGAHPG